MPATKHDEEWWRQGVVWRKYEVEENMKKLNKCDTTIPVKCQCMTKVKKNMKKAWRKIQIYVSKKNRRNDILNEGMMKRKWYNIFALMT